MMDHSYRKKNRETPRPSTEQLEMTMHVGIFFLRMSRHGEIWRNHDVSDGIRRGFRFGDSFYDGDGDWFCLSF